MVDTRDLKSLARKGVWVQVPPGVLRQCGNSSVGRARPCQGRGREFESRFPLFFSKKPNRKVGLFYFKSLKIKSVIFGRSPPASQIFPKTIQESIQGGKFER